MHLVTKTLDSIITKNHRKVFCVICKEECLADIDGCKLATQITDDNHICNYCFDEYEKRLDIKKNQN